MEVPPISKQKAYYENNKTLLKAKALFRYHQKTPDPICKEKKRAYDRERYINIKLIKEAERQIQAGTL